MAQEAEFASRERTEGASRCCCCRFLVLLVQASSPSRRAPSPLLLCGAISLFFLVRLIPRKTHKTPDLDTEFRQPLPLSLSYSSPPSSTERQPASAYTLMPSLPFSLFSRPSQPSPPPPPRSPIPAPLTPPVPHQDDHRPAEEEEEPQQQPPHSPLSAPFSLRSHKLDDVRLASSLPFDSGGGGTMYDSFSTGERLLSPAIGSGGGEGGGGMPYFSAQGETLFGPSPGVSPLSEARASPSPRLVVRDGVRSDRERENLREKYGLPREKEEKLERLLAAVHRGKGTEGQTRMNEAGGGRREQSASFDSYGRENED